MPEPTAEEDLYEFDPAQFTGARDALVKRLRAEGQRDQAAVIAKLRRPPVTAWALNQVARHRPDLIRAVLDTGDRLRSAMTNAVGGDATDLRDAQGGQRRAVDAAVAAAADCLQRAGHPGNDTARQRMVATLGAAIVDKAVACRLRDGVLDGDRSAPGFGLDAMSVPARPPTKASGPKRDTGSVRARTDQVEDTARRLEAETVERERRQQERIRHAELETRANRLLRRAERLEKHAEEAERQAAQAREAAEDARAEATRAQSRADKTRVQED